MYDDVIYMIYINSAMSKIKYKTETNMSFVQHVKRLCPYTKQFILYISIYVLHKSYNYVHQSEYK